MMDKFQICIIAFVHLTYIVSNVTPDPYPNIEELVTSNGYPFEKHLTETEDGYFLEIHRIPGGKSEKEKQTAINKPTVFLFHGLTMSSIDWITVGANVSLAFYFADEGFDVWLGNARGTLFAKKHKIYSDSSSQFWNYSWHEIGFYDVPAMVDVILEKTGKSQIYYTCFSQGCTSLVVMGSLRPEYNKKIRMAANMALVAYTGHCPGIGAYINPIIAEIFVPFFETFGHFGLITTPAYEAFQRILVSNDLVRTVVFYAFNLILGPSDLAEHEAGFINISRYIPGGFSSKQALHYDLGVLNTNTFRPYDYGSEKNMMIYNSSSPPEYPVEKVDIPMVIFQGLNDYIANNVDVDIIMQKLPNVVRLYKSKGNHIDFIVNNNVRNLYYDKIVEMFKMSEQSLEASKNID